MAKKQTKNNALRALFVYNAVFVMAISMLGPLYAVYVEKFVDGVTAITISWAAFLISTSVFTYIVSKTGDRMKEKKHLMLAGYLARMLGWILLIFVHSLETLILVQVLLGIGEALGTPAFHAIFAEHLDRNEHIREYSNWLLIANITSAIGIILGGIVVDNLGFRTLFLIMATLSMVTFFGILFKPKKLL